MTDQAKLEALHDRHAQVIAYDDNKQRCSFCGRATVVEWAITNEAWDRMRQPGFDGVACLDCFAERTHEKIMLRDIRFLAVGHSILLDTMPGSLEAANGQRDALEELADMAVDYAAEQLLGPSVHS